MQLYRHIHASYLKLIHINVIYTMLCFELTLSKKRKCDNKAAFSQINEISSINQIPNQDLITVTDETQLVTGVTTLLFILDLIFELKFTLFI
jgi:hypothetical protein